MDIKTSPFPSNSELLRAHPEFGLMVWEGATESSRSVWMESDGEYVSMAICQNGSVISEIRYVCGETIEYEEYACPKSIQLIGPGFEKFLSTPRTEREIRERFLLVADSARGIINLTSKTIQIANEEWFSISLQTTQSQYQQETLAMVIDLKNRLYGRQQLKVLAQI